MAVVAMVGEAKCPLALGYIQSLLVYCSVVYSCASVAILRSSLSSARLTFPQACLLGRELSERIVTASDRKKAASFLPLTRIALLLEPVGLEPPLRDNPATPCTGRSRSRPLPSTAPGSQVHRPGLQKQTPPACPPPKHPRACKENHARA